MNPLPRRLDSVRSRLVLLFLLAPLFAAAGERELRIDCGFGMLDGTLRTPEGGSRTVVLIIAGSGPTDRDGNATAQGLYTDSYLQLADALERRGIASLRYDKRGVGASFYRDPEAIYDVVFDDYVADTEAWVARLRTEGFDRVVLAGHSEGALVALCAAADAAERTRPDPLPAPANDTNDTEAAHPADEAGRLPEKTFATPNHDTEPPRIDALVLIAGPAEPVDRLLLAQLAPHCDPGEIFRLTQFFGQLRQGETSEKYPRAFAALFQPYLQRFLISQMRYDPSELASRLDLPMLLLYGGNDLQVPARHGELLERVAQHAKLVVVPNMTHTLKPSDGRDPAGQASAYMDARQPLCPAAAAAVAEFVLRL